MLPAKRIWRFQLRKDNACFNTVWRPLLKCALYRTAGSRLTWTFEKLQCCLSRLSGCAEQAPRPRPIALEPMSFTTRPKHLTDTCSGTARISMPKSIPAAHTVVWAFFAGCIIAIPLAAWLDEYQAVARFATAVFVEVLILVCNRMRCSLTSLAARYTIDRRENFDIYLPL